MNSLCNACIQFSSSQQVKQSLFQDLADKGINIIFFDLAFYGIDNETFIEVEKRRRWVWIAKDQRYVLGYPEDVDVFSFGLLKAKQDFLKVNISIGNFSTDCRLHFDKYLSQYLMHIINENDTISSQDNRQICHSKIESYDKISEFIINLSGVKIGYHFWCLTKNNEFEVVEKSYVNVIVIIIILFLYAFYPLIIEMAFYTHSTNYKTQFYRYYKSDSPYSPARFLLRLIYTGSNKYFAALRIIILVMVLTSLVYLAKSEVYSKCDCSLKSSNDEGKFQHAENYYMTTVNRFFVAWGVLNFALVNACVLMNSGGIFDDFLIIDLSNICADGNIFRLIPVIVFLPVVSKDALQSDEMKSVSRTYTTENFTTEMINDTNTVEDTRFEKSLVSFKIHKLSLILSYKFWTRIFLIRGVDFKYRWAYVTSIILFPINAVLILFNAICPIVSIFYIFLSKFITCILFVCKSNCCFREKNEDQSIDKQNVEQSDIESPEASGEHSLHFCENKERGGEQQNSRMTGKSCREKALSLFCNLLCHAGVGLYIVFSYEYSFNIFFYGMSYLVQFFIYTVLLALPHYPVQVFIYIIFVTSVIVYLFRYVHQFIELYKNLLNEIFEITEETSISIQDFNRIVTKYFPLKNEVFYLLLKITVTSLFFIIIFDTMQKVEYIKIGARLDWTTVISLLFVFGPPRIVEELLVTDFTSRVHMKRTEIKKYINEMKTGKIKSVYVEGVLADYEKDWLKSCSKCACKCKCENTFKSKDILRSSSNDIILCEEGCRYCKCCCVLRLICTFSCGCFNCPIDSQRRCDFCNAYAVKETSEATEVTNKKIMLKCHCYPPTETQKKLESGTEQIIFEDTRL
ncbi:uncharacterized protein LOC133172038 [Saccostrea echinata]|uniref:uncharacterized protein LOC133172038 n=1 Tax=Saccostrea echinata TaxID=191078 RepID=UPI002A804E0F|nr:uncharacterized protein LOC133172038 [Saccostrea echinata]